MPHIFSTNSSDDEDEVIVDENKNYLGICELYNECMYGRTESSPQNIETHFMVFDILSNLDEFWSSTYRCILGNLQMKYSIFISLGGGDDDFKLENPSIRNYREIIMRPDYLKLDIVNVRIFGSGETVACLKTFWLRLVQRKWKRVYKERKRILQIRSRVKSLECIRTTGKWPKGANHWPLLRLYEN